MSQNRKVHTIIILFTYFAISLTSAPGIATIATIATISIVAATTSVRPCITISGATVPTGGGARGLVGGGEVERAVAGGHLQYSGAVHCTLYSTAVPGCSTATGVTPPHPPDLAPSPCPPPPASTDTAASASPQICVSEYLLGTSVASFSRRWSISPTFSNKYNKLTHSRRKVN